MVSSSATNLAEASPLWVVVHADLPLKFAEHAVVSEVEQGNMAKVINKIVADFSQIKYNFFI